MQIYNRTISYALAAVMLLALSAHGLMAQSATTRVVNAANAFLATLTAQQRQSVLFAYDDEQQRVRWSNFPISIVPRAGLPFKDMTPGSVPRQCPYFPPRSARKDLRRFSRSWMAMKC